MSDLSMNSQALQAQGTYREPNWLSQTTGTLTYTRDVIEGQHCICEQNEWSVHEQSDLAGSRYIQGTKQTLTNDRYANLY